MDFDFESLVDAPFQSKPQSTRDYRGRSRSRSPRASHPADDSGHPPRRRLERSPSPRSSRREHGENEHDRRGQHREENRHRRGSSPQYRPRSRERRPEPRRYSPPPARRPRTPSPDPLTRDERTVFVAQLAQRLRHRELFDFFSQAGRVKDARIVTDKITRRSKGVGYVEFYEQTSVEKAVQLTGQKLLGLPVVVQRSEAEKNRIAEVNAAQTKIKEQIYTRLYIGAVHFNIAEDELRLVFEPFGELEYVSIQRDPETGRSKGYGFVQYKRPMDAKLALEKMNGFELAGQQIRVGLVTEKGAGIVGGYTLDDTEVKGVALSSQSRIELMQKLARDPAPYKHITDAPAARPSVPAMQVRTVVLKNMFSPEEETEPNWASELEVDVAEECAKFGDVVHIHVDKYSEGEIYVKFAAAQGAEAAIKSLNGRWFAKRQVQASIISELVYHTRFPKSAGL